MLPQKYRLTKDRDFKKLNVSGRAFFSPDFRLKYLANNSPRSRLAIVISTKVSKKATQRNRLKRQLREIIRHHLDQIKSGYDIVVSAKISALNQEYQQLEKNLLALLTKAKLLK